MSFTNSNLVPIIINNFDPDSNISQVQITYQPISNPDGTMSYEYKSIVLLKPNSKTYVGVNFSEMSSNNQLFLNVVTKANSFFANNPFVVELGTHSSVIAMTSPGQEILIDEYILNEMPNEPNDFQEIQLHVSNNQSRKKRKSTIIYTGPSVFIKILIKIKNFLKKVFSSPRSQK